MPWYRVSRRTCWRRESLIATEQSQDEAGEAGDGAELIGGAERSGRALSGSFRHRADR